MPGDVRSHARDSAIEGGCAQTDEACSSDASFVAMVETANFWEGHHVTLRNGLHVSRRRRVFRQREVSSRGVIIGEIAGQRAPQMPLVEDDHMVETFAANGSDQALDVRILPRTGRR